MGQRHCALDLELEQPKSNPQTPDSLLEEEKIIQVGYVIYELEPEFKVLEKVSRFVNIGVPLSQFIKDLTRISDEQIANGTTIEAIYDELVEKQKQYRFVRGVKQWGGGDMDCLRKEVPNSRWEFGRSGVNIKHLYQTYAEATGKNRSGGLSRSMAKCGLIWEGRGKHDAMLDALNTARFHNFFYSTFKRAYESFVS